MLGATFKVVPGASVLHVEREPTVAWCGRAIPHAAETDRLTLDANAIRHKGADVCSRCRTAYHVNAGDEPEEVNMTRKASTSRKSGTARKTAGARKTTNAKTSTAKPVAAKGAVSAQAIVDELQRLEPAVALKRITKRVASTQFALAHPEKYSKSGYSKERVKELEAKLAAEKEARESIRERAAAAKPASTNGATKEQREQDAAAAAAVLDGDT